MDGSTPTSEVPTPTSEIPVQSAAPAVPEGLPVVPSPDLGGGEVIQQDLDPDALKPVPLMKPAEGLVVGDPAQASMMAAEAEAAANRAKTGVSTAPAGNPDQQITVPAFVSQPPVGGVAPETTQAAQSVNIVPPPSLT